MGNTFKLNEPYFLCLIISLYQKILAFAYEYPPASQDPLFSDLGCHLAAECLSSQEQHPGFKSQACHLLIV